MSFQMLSHNFLLILTRYNLKKNGQERFLSLYEEYCCDVKETIL